MKICSACKISKDGNEFHNNKSMRDGKHSQCKKCAKAYRQTPERKIAREIYQKSYKRTPKGKVAHRASYYKRLYGLTLGQHKLMYIDQDGCCIICKNAISYSEVVTDHDHNTGRVRGLLCSSCNMKLGWYEKNRQNVNVYLEGK